MRYACFLALLLFSIIATAEETHQRCPYHTQTQSMTGDHQKCPMHQNHQTEELNRRGDQVMGFSQEKTTHHFLLTKNGGKILVEAKDSEDEKTIQQIRTHMKLVRDSFSSGDFEMPHAVHLEMPPGADVMKKSKHLIQYRYQETETGAAVVISAESSEVQSAIQSFFKFQIEEHQTGDPLESN
jgi:hypothetical protein